MQIPVKCQHVFNVKLEKRNLPKDLPPVCLVVLVNTVIIVLNVKRVVIDVAMHWMQQNVVNVHLVFIKMHKVVVPVCLVYRVV